MEQKNKNMIYGIVFGVLAVLLVVSGILFAKFRDPAQHNQAKFGTYKIRLDGWDGTPNEQYRRWASETLGELNRLGPTFQIVTGEADIAVTKIDLATSSRDCQTLPVIVYVPRTPSGQPRIMIDPVCTNGEMEFKTAFMHEIGHSLGMSHVCRLSDNRSDCSSVGRGPAVMNPNLLYENVNNTDDTDQVIGPQPTWQFQSLDFKEFCRVRNCN